MSSLIPMGMEMCAALIPRHSVDYQVGKQKCFMGSHHGNSIITASSFQRAPIILGAQGFVAVEEGVAVVIPQLAKVSLQNRLLSLTLFGGMKVLNTVSIRIWIVI
jgi:hypothetical protein